MYDRCIDPSGPLPFANVMQSEKVRTVLQWRALMAEIGDTKDRVARMLFVPGLVNRPFRQDQPTLTRVVP